ncbi:MAG: hypothetical protein AAFO94_18490 [Bacteroidota bacterium]
MKHYLLFLSMWLCCVVSTGAQEQIASGFSASTLQQAEAQQKSVAYYYRHHQKLPARYSGYLIELKRSTRPLRRDHHLFRQFGGVFIDRLPGGGYSYGIPVDFSTRFQMKQYLKNVVLPKAGEARIVKYKNGNRRAG